MFITIQKLSDKIRKRNIELPRAKETLNGRNLIMTKLALNCTHYDNDANSFLLKCEIIQVTSPKQIYCNPKKDINACYFYNRKGSFE